eukprot:6121937-Pleurochrysis_carterae.AAC.6
MQRLRARGEERAPATLHRAVRGQAVAASVQAGRGREQQHGEGWRHAAEVTGLAGVHNAAHHFG